MQPQQPGQPPYGQQPPMGGPPAGGAAGGPPNPAQTPAIILAVCAALIAVGVLTKSWMTAGEERFSVGIGLLGMKACAGDRCETAGWGDKQMKGIDGDVKAFGYLGFITGLAAIGACGYMAFLAFQRQQHKIPVKVMNGVLGAAAFCSTFFLVRLLTSDGAERASLSYSGFLAIGGLVGAGFVLKQMLTPLIKQGAGAAAPAYAAAAPMGAAPAGAAAAVACPRCGGQAAYVAQYQRHYCNACQQYV